MSVISGRRFSKAAESHLVLCCHFFSQEQLHMLAGNKEGRFPSPRAQYPAPLFPAFS